MNERGHLWHGRFEEAPADALMAFTESISFDVLLAADDITGSRAHITMLAARGIVTDAERDQVLAALDVTAAEFTNGTFAFAPSDEDIHTAVERRVTELAGEAGAKLHTGRSRNDQAATDTRLYLLREGRRSAAAVLDLMRVLLDRAESAGDAYLPGYTHLQRAQPVLLAHHLLAHLWALARDLDRWLDALDRANMSPLGAGALAGSSLPLDPGYSAELLGFDRVFENSLDAVSDRDYVAEPLFVAALTQVHLSRLGEEVVLWTTDEFGFMRLADAYSTGSSMLPQKKNPDIAELARGKAGRLIGNLAGFLATMKGLPLAYNRDLQEDKEPLFDSLDQVRLGAIALAGTYASATFDTDAMAAAADAPANVATDLAEHLVRAGVPFREAHARVGALVRAALSSGGALTDLVRDAQGLGPDALVYFEPGAGVRHRTTPGGAGPVPVAVQLDAARARLTHLATRLTQS